MARFVVTMDIDNAAFGDDTPEYEIQRILVHLGHRLIDQSLDFGTFALFDINGNRVGSAQREND